MKRSGFKPRKPLRGAKRPLGRDKKQKAPRVRKVKNKGYKVPSWFRSIKPGAHGQSPSQKRLWRIVSETYRQEDAKKYGTKCPICFVEMGSWRGGQLGHWLRYSLCNSFFKYCRENLALICAGCNYKDDAVTLKRLGEVLEYRHGEDILLWIEQENQVFRGRKMEEWAIVDYAKKVNPKIVYEKENTA